MTNFLVTWFITFLMILGIFYLLDAGPDFSDYCADNDTGIVLYNLDDDYTGYYIQPCE